jgi:hypothetical protein
MAREFPSASSAPAIRAGPRRARVNFSPMERRGTRARTSSSAARRTSAGADGIKLKRTRSNRKSRRSIASAIRFGVRGCRASARRTLARAANLPSSAIALTTFAVRSKRARSEVTCGSSRFGLSRSARRSSSRASCTSRPSSWLLAERARTAASVGESGGIFHCTLEMNGHQQPPFRRQEFQRAQYARIPAIILYRLRASSKKLALKDQAGRKAVLSKRVGWNHTRKPTGEETSARVMVVAGETPALYCSKMRAQGKNPFVVVGLHSCQPRMRRSRS